MPKFDRAIARAFCGGSFAPYALSLAVVGVKRLFEEASYVPLRMQGLASYSQSWIIPVLDPAKLCFAVLYDPRMHRISAEALANPKSFHRELPSNWRRVCRAYVVAEIDPLKERPFYCIGHGGTGKAEYELTSRAYLDASRHSIQGMMTQGACYLREYAARFNLPGLPASVDQMLLAESYVFN